MIPRFTDLAANERTFLAWVRTAIAVIAFGFVVEKFELFLHYMSAQPGRKTQLPPHVTTAETVGLVLVGLGIAMIAVAAVRFVLTRRRIRADDPVEDAPVTMDVLLSILLILLVSFVAVYFLHSIGKLLFGL